VTWPGVGLGLSLVLIDYQDKPINIPILVFFAVAGSIAFIWGAIENYHPLQTHDQKASGSAQRKELPGFCAHFIIRMHGPHVVRRRYVFELLTAEGASAAFYLSASDRFVFEVKDTRGEPYTLEAPLGGDGIPLGEFCYLTASAGIASNASFLSVELNGRELQRRDLPFPIDLGSKVWDRGCIGSDAKGKNNGGFDLGEKVVRSSTLNEEDAVNLLRYFERKWFDRSKTADAKTRRPIR
jgi:hypothetical protein